ncbi:MAG: nucleotidyltransferase domain-containing protein [Egibacteraceae bacterium]
MRALTEVDLPEGLTLERLHAALRAADARFAYLHGSRVQGTQGPRSDLDVAAWFGRPVGAWEVALPASCDLLVLDTAGAELAGRVAHSGVVLLDDDPPSRVAWQADHAKRYLDEAHRRRELVRTVLHRG